MRTKRNAAYAVRKVTRDALFGDPTRKAAIAEISDRAKAAIRESRAACGLYWGTYLLVEDAAAAFGKGPPPRFQGWRGDGRIGVQVQNGMAWSELLAGEDTRLRLVRNGDVYNTQHPSGKRESDKHYRLWMRIGSDGRAPIWAKIPITIHRQPDDSAMIKWCVLHRRIVAGIVEWSVTFTLDMCAGISGCDGTHTVGVDVGYRAMPGGVQRVAVAIGSDGARHELTLSERIIGAFSSAEEIASTRDMLFNEAVASLKTWMAAAERPAWLVERLATLASWRSNRRLAKVIEEWRQRSDVAGDGSIIAAMNEWMQWEKHLNRYEQLSRLSGQRGRQDLYRNWVAMLRKTYGVAVIENMNLNAAIHDVIKPADEREVVTPQRRIARWAAMSTLCKAIKQSGMEVVKVPPEYTTLDCHACGGRCDFDAANTLRHTCEHCAAEWDHDDNAARNLLARGEATREGRGSLASIAPQGVATGDDAPAKPSRYEIRTAARKRLLATKPRKEL